MRRDKHWAWAWLWFFTVVGWAFALAYMIEDMRGGALDLF